MEEHIKISLDFIPSPDEIKNYILKTEEPLIIKNMLSWTMLNWSLDDWIENLGDIDLEMRVGHKKCTKEPLWETSCAVVEMSVKDIFKSNEINNACDQWMYFDYKHMKNYFQGKTDLLKAISWKDFGFPNKDGNDSTIWIGTQGAYTPCHMDSYGCNIIAQVYGRKLWILFPPNKTAQLKPTRVPYEESSVYSSINFSCGLNVSNELDQAKMVELSPGDILIVPKNWWHYVENLSTAISINMWIPLDSDDESRLEESLVRFFLSLTLKTIGKEEGSSLLNPNEIMLMDESIDIQLISRCVDHCLNKEVSQVTEIDGSVSADHQKNVLIVPSVTADDLRNILLNKCKCILKECRYESNLAPELTLENVINAYCHPEIVAKVAHLLKEQKFKK